MKQSAPGSGRWLCRLPKHFSVGRLRENAHLRRCAHSSSLNVLVSSKPNEAFCCGCCNIRTYQLYSLQPHQRTVKYDSSSSGPCSRYFQALQHPHDEPSYGLELSASLLRILRALYLNIFAQPRGNLKTNPCLIWNQAHRPQAFSLFDTNSFSKDFIGKRRGLLLFW